MYKNILVTHGGTSASDKALKHALHIAKTNKSKVRILYVMEDLEHASILIFESNVRDKVKRDLKRANTELKKEAENHLEKKAKPFLDEGIPTTIRVKAGYPVDEIVKETKQNKIDLLIMARRRKLPGIKKLMALGSVTRKVTESVSCPVLIIDI